MCLRKLLVVLLCLLACGCGKTKTTDELIADLQSDQEKDRVSAARLLGQRVNEADKVIPALITALKDKEADTRRSAALGLGAFGEQAKAAIPDLEAARKDKDARVKNAAIMALSRIDPAKFSR